MELQWTDKKSRSRFPMAKALIDHEEMTDVTEVGIEEMAAAMEEEAEALAEEEIMAGK